LDPNTFEQIGHVQVCNGNIPVPQLNELEYVNGYVYANVFQQRNIAIINPETGQVKGWIDLSSLQGTTDSNPENVLNGIAYDAEGNRLFVTGKNWAFLYEIRLFPLD
jgi:glutamine cyclotransferase